jgi:hypothetical protein
MEMRVVVPDGASTGSLANRLTAVSETNSLLALSLTIRTKE